MAKSNPYNDYGLTGKVTTKKYRKNSNPYDSYGRDSSSDAVAEQKAYREQLAQKVASRQQPQTKQQVKQTVQKQAKESTFAKARRLATHNVITDTAGGLVKGAKNTVDIPVSAGKQVVAKATGNKKANINAGAETKKNYDESLAKSFVDPFNVTVKKAQKQVKHLAGPTRSEQGKGGADEIIANQKRAAKDPQYAKLLGGMKDVPADAKIKADEMRAKGKKLHEVQAYLKKAQAAQQANNRQGAGTAVAIASMAVGGGGVAKSVKAGKAVSKADKAADIANTAVVGGVGNEAATISANPNATKKELAESGAAGFVLGGAARAGGMAIGNLTRKPDVTSSKVAVGQQAMDKLTAEKDKLVKLKVEHPNQPQVDDAIKNVDKKIADVAKVNEKNTVDTQKTTEKNQAEVKKIDQQVELIQAKKKDAGKLSNVDQTKLKQLKEKKEELTLYRGGKEFNSSLSTHKHIADDYAKNRGGSVSEHKLSPDARVVNYADIPNVKYKDIDDYNIATKASVAGKDTKKFYDEDLEADYAVAAKWAKDNGYDAVRFPTEGEVRVLNRAVLKGGETPPPPLPRPETVDSKTYNVNRGAGQGSTPKKQTVTDETKKPESTAGESTKPPSTGANSRVYARLRHEHPDDLTDDVSYEATTLKEQADRAVKQIEDDKQKAYRIATGQESSPDLTATAANIALAEKALDEGNVKLYSDLVRNRSLAQTRRGQELVNEKASISDNSTSRYVKELLDSRLEQLGKRMTTGIQMGKKGSAKESAIIHIDKEVAKYEAKIKARKLDTKTALDLLDKMECL